MVTEAMIYVLSRSTGQISSCKVWKAIAAIEEYRKDFPNRISIVMALTGGAVVEAGMQAFSTRPWAFQEAA